jgi:hypothetical protein
MCLCRVPVCPLVAGYVCLATETQINTADGVLVRGHSSSQLLKVVVCTPPDPPPPPTCSLVHVHGKRFPGNFELVIPLHIHSIRVPFSTAALVSHSPPTLLVRP